MLKIKDNVDLKELEKYGWKPDSLYCFKNYKCDKCPNREKCRVIADQWYYKSISEYLSYTTIHCRKDDKEIYGRYDDYETIYSESSKYKYIKNACQKEIKAGIIEEVDDKDD